VLSGLAQLGYQVFAASNGISGLRIVERELPALLLLETVLPELPGTAVIDEIQRLPPNKRPRIVVLTTAATPSDPVAGRCVDGVLTWPFSADDVVGRVEWVRGVRRHIAESEKDDDRAQPARRVRHASVSKGDSGTLQVTAACD
jgi:DNA-binding response OmpR family regulator